MNYEIINGDCLTELDKLDKNSVDCIVTDPPYELNFMGKGWDNAGVSFNKETWAKCLRVLKPGGYLLAFGGSRTYHRIACAIEDAGFELRDTIMWLYGSGFPKSMNIGLAIDKRNGVESKVVGKGKSGVSSRAFQSEETTTAGGYEIKKANNKWNGWGSALKPAFEPIIVARKPFKGSLIDNILRYRVGGLNIDECRVGNEVIKGGTMPDFRDVGKKSKEAIGIDKLSFGQVENAKRKPLDDHTGRFPANVILTYDENDFDEVCGGFPSTKGDSRTSKPTYDKSIWGNAKSVKSNCLYADSGSASRYFYCAKASKRDRDEGLEDFEKLKRNTHPTVKPTSLMQYLVRLVAQKGATILDPFMGSGSTGKAVMKENQERNTEYKFIGIEREEEYCKIAEARIKRACVN